ncbi:MAG TPA: DNA-processing protein DprA [Bacteroidia bacterium]|jgi:DNA processing protein|nr:DNA-processing protein DprA [Bacteroidia bacterium]
MTQNDELFYRIALTLIPGIGDITAKKLLAHCGSASEIFRLKKEELKAVHGIGVRYAKAILNHAVFKRAEEEMRFIEAESVQTFFYQDADYPERLKQCADGPLLIYYKGTAPLDQPRVIGIVGTRRASFYGIDRCKEVVHNLAAWNPLVVSGLAYGIDICAHKACIQHKLETIAVLAHGLDSVYPVLHRSAAARIMEQGGLLSDFPSRSKAEVENFPKRNRIVAGLCDAILVIESARDGGSMITADIANSYDRDVFAFPGRTTDGLSAGCHKLIKENKAALVEDASDIIRLLGWDIHRKTASVQTELFPELGPDEQQIAALIKEQGELHIDRISALTAIPMHKISSLLLHMEFAGALRALPGKMYKLN